MSFGLLELLTSSAALCALPFFFLLPGYGVAVATDVAGFRARTLSGKLAWATALSLPISLLCVTHPGLPVPTFATTAALLVLDTFALVWLMREVSRGGGVHASWAAMWQEKADRLALWVAAALVPFVFFSSLPVSVHGRIYESSLWQDWTIRTQLIGAAIRGGNVPRSPFFAVAGQPPPLHYYYFWYVLCARMHDLVPVNSRALLTASCVGAGLALLAFLLVALEALHVEQGRARRQVRGLLVAAAILGLDLVAVIPGLVVHRFYPDVQFWLDDRTPGFLNMILWSPHHVAGLVCCGMAVVLFVSARGRSWRECGACAVLGGVCLAASAGTSTLITLLFATGCGLIFADALLRREFKVAWTLALGAVLSGMLALPFFWQLLHSAAASAAAAPPGPKPHLLHPALRYQTQASNLLWHGMRMAFHGLHTLPRPGQPHYVAVHWSLRLLRLPTMLWLALLDLGFFWFVLAWQAQRDFRRSGGEAMPRRARLLWLLAAGIGIPGLLVSSAGLQANNDFGRHAGFCMRFVLTLWAAPYVTRALEGWQRHRATGQAWTLTPAKRWALAFALVGLAGQAAQVLLTRTHFALTDAGLVPRDVVEERIPRLAFRFGQVQRAMAAANAMTPRDGLVQSNPHAMLHNVFMLYSDRQMAAADDGCNTPFGGDPRLCAPQAAALIALFGGMGRTYQGQPTAFAPGAIGFRPEAVTPENFARVCETLHLDTVVASYLDPAWWDRTSWVWRLRPVYGNATARVYRCPAGPAAELRKSPGTSAAPMPVH